MKAQIEELRRELDRTRADLSQARARIAAMEMSKFWKLRNFWWDLKERIRLGSKNRFEKVSSSSPAGTAPSVHPSGRRVPYPGRPPSSVDVVVCVHNALEDVRECLDSVVRNSTPPFRLVLVDDGSDEETRQYLTRFARTQRAELIRNEAARGYTFAANQGLRASGGDHVILLNSDTVVPSGWLERLVTCAESDPRIGLAGPLSNCASWQSIPEVAGDDGDWASNPLPDSFSPDLMTALLAEDCGLWYPRMPFLNGFCILIRRKVLEDVGLFDEESFGKGYGEENDYCLRARAKGFELALADDLFVLHKQSKSYSSDRRKVLSDAAGVALGRKHSQARIDAGVEECRNGRVLEALRLRSRELESRHRERREGRARWEGKRVLFVLPVCDRGGGANIVFSEAREMVRMGVDARVLNLTEFRGAFEKSYPDPDVPVLFAQPAGIPDAARSFDAVIATHNASVEWIAPLAGEAKAPVLGYYIQDYEPLFYPDGSRDAERAKRSYRLIPDLVRFTKTDWNRREVEARAGVSCAVVGPSFDQTLFRPVAGAPPMDRIRIAAMARPSSARRQPALTMDILEEVSAKYGSRVEITVFGDDPTHPDFPPLCRSFPYTSAGVLDGLALASLFNRVHLFADFSAYQAMGLSALEAMGCGATAIVPTAGGAGSFARHEENALFIDTSLREECLAAVCRLVDDPALLSPLMARAYRDVLPFHPAAASSRILHALFPDA